MALFHVIAGIVGSVVAVRLIAAAYWLRYTRGAHTASQSDDGGACVAAPLSPGGLCIRDFRASHKVRSSSDGSDACDGAHGTRHSLRVVSWNIERGDQFERVARELEHVNADVILLQEVDSGCERTGSVDVGAALAERLGMVLVFGVEFQEVHSRLRSRRTQGGGVHGNAILSKFDVTAAWCVPHTHQPFSWPKWGHLLRQPRRGGRCFVGAELRTGLAAMPLLRAYSVHLECVAGAHGRLRQLGEVLQHSASRRRLGSATGAGGAPASRHVPVLIGGDANTLLTGVMKTNPMYWDRWTLPCLGMTEAKLWHQLLPIRTNHQPHIPHIGPWSPSLPQELVQGARDACLGALLEPFDPDRDTTTRGMAGAWTAKLDWLMLGGTSTMKGCTLKISNAATGGSGASDHEWVCYDVDA